LKPGGGEVTLKRSSAWLVRPAAQHERLVARGWDADQNQAPYRPLQLPVEQKIARSHFVIWAEGLLEVPAPAGSGKSSNNFDFPRDEPLSFLKGARARMPIAFIDFSGRVTPHGMLPFSPIFLRHELDGRCAGQLELKRSFGTRMSESKSKSLG